MEKQPDARVRAKKVRLVIFDVDGVLTDGGIYMGAEGELFKPFFCRDGLGISLAHRNGLKTAIITGRQSPQTWRRAEDLGIAAVYQGATDKRIAFQEILKNFELVPEEVAYIGDDLIDLPVMMLVGFPAAVFDAVPEVKTRSVFISSLPGGRGAVREILEFILDAQGKWTKIVEEYTNPQLLEQVQQ